jgi:glycine cleavage system transcriptional repressor
MSTRFEHSYVLNVVADDHPGIVAAVTDAVGAFQGNIDACSQTVVRGYFTLIMIVSFPEPVATEALVEAVRGTGAGASEFQVVARPFHVSAWTRQSQPAERFVFTAFGKDTPGIVRKFSQYLAGKDINILDLYGERCDEDFVLISQVDVPSQLDIGMLQAELEAIGRADGFTVRLQHENVFVATNQLRLTREERAGRPPSRR